MLFLAESGHPVFGGTSPRRAAYNCRLLVAHHCFCQSACYFRSHRGLVPGTWSASRRSITTGTLAAKMDNALSSKVPSEDVSRTTKGSLWSPQVQCGNTMRNSNLPEDLLLIKTCDGAEFSEKISPGHLLITILDVQLEAPQTHAENMHTYPRSDGRSRPKWFIRGNTKLGPGTASHCRKTC